MSFPSRRTWLALVLALGSVGCTMPRVITNITFSGDQAKMIYAQANTTNTGVIQCKVAADGKLVECKKVSVTFQKPAK